jgi:hypothetical protein
MQPAVASQLQTWWLHMTEFLVVNLTDLYNKPLFYNGKRKILTNFHTKHIGINDWIYINFKHTWKIMWNDNKTLGMSQRWHSVTPPPTFPRNQNIGERMEKKNWQNIWMGK